MTKRKKLNCIVSRFLLLAIAYQTFLPTISLALTGGPSQPEVESFSPIDASNSVDLFSGDFNYNIPLLDVGGYPVNLTYNSNPSLDQEASWVGLGWNINVGSLNRNMRGLPDDFSGGDLVEPDKITKESNLKANETWGVNVSGDLEIVGFDILRAAPPVSVGISRNSYTGYNITYGASLGILPGKSGKGPLNASLGINFGSQDGMNLSASANLQMKEEADVNLGVNSSFNSRSGLKNISYSASISKKFESINRLSLGMKGGSSISFAPNTYTPTISMPMNTSSFNLNVKTGVDLFAVVPNLAVSGFYSKSVLDKNVQKSEAFGYLNSHAGAGLTDLHDFNREKDLPYVDGIPFLPQPNFTYDLFSATGQGVSGQFRAYRSDAGILYDSKSMNSSSSTSAGVEIAALLAVHGGFDITQCGVLTESEKWTDDNSLKDKVDFISNGSRIGYEHAGFKCIGEKVPMERTVYDLMGADLPSRVELSTTSAYAEQSIARFSHNKQPLGSKFIRRALKKSQREKRNTVFSYLTSEEAGYYGFENEINSFEKNSISVFSPNCIAEGRGHEFAIPRSAHPRHHISEVTVNTPEGKRYIYGIPAYNNFQKDVTFAVPETTATASITNYPSNANSTSNSYGVDNYFNAETVPGYAYSYLLTAILSPDYAKKGYSIFSNQDNGNLIKFNYTKTSDDYKWRVPYENMTANYNPGINSNNGNIYGDAKASYSYGSKELWYLHSIESESMIAQFLIADREDGCGVTGENGGRDISQRQQLLYQIKLFSKSDIRKYQQDAVPVKCIHFVYDYSLCPNVPNNAGGNPADAWYLPNANTNKGKLTLKRVYFTYGNSERGRLNAYKFNYDDTDPLKNPSYQFRMNDRWGNYKDNSQDPSFSGATNSEFPYVLQNSLTDQFMNAWQLQSIQLPTGGSLKMEYESDDYAYVQDKRAASMFKVMGFSKDIITAPQAELFNGSTPYAYLHISPTGNVAGLTPAQLEGLYLEGLNYLSYKMFVHTKNSYYDYINGYVEVDRSAGSYIGYNSTTNTIWVKVKCPDGYNPVSRATWQFMRLQAPDLAYNYSSNPSTNVIQAIRGLVGSIGDVVTLLKGFENKAKDGNWGRSFNRDKSFVRANQPDYKKRGGGSRVRTLTTSDNWRLMTDYNSPQKDYTQEFDYTTVNNDGVKISSGVAAWEPAIGGEENPFHNPLYYTVKRKLGPTDHLWLDEPVCESLYPSPTIGYSKVTVRTKSEVTDNIIRTATGSSINEFYTAKDYPVIASFTNPFPIKKPKNQLPSFFGITRDYCSVSQGFFIETNDMHGKQRAQHVLNSNGAIISSTLYSYLNDMPHNGRGRLKNEVQTVDPKGEVHKKLIGQDGDFYFDMRQQETELVSVGVDFNNEFIWIPLFLFLNISPLPYPDIQSEITRFRSVTNMKNIQKYGLVDEVTVIKDGSKVTTKNLLYDDETGQVVLTRTINEFGENLFNVSYPAHWAYEGMGPAYKNIGLKIPDIYVSNGRLVSSINANDYLVPGDEIEIIDGTSPTGAKYWVYEYAPGDNRLMDRYGDPANNGSGTALKTLKVLRSGRRNQSDIPVGGATILKDNPVTISGTDTLLRIDNTRITQTSAQEFDDRWKINCNQVLDEACDTMRPKFCLGKFFNLAIDYVNDQGKKAITAKPQDSITVGEIMRACNCSCFLDSMEGQLTDSMPFFLITASNPVTHAEWQFGQSCKLIMNTNGTIPLNINNLLVQTHQLGSTDSCISVGDGRIKAEICIECIGNCNEFCRDKLIAESRINPYVSGLLGNWYPKRMWSYLEERSPAVTNSSRVRDDGYFATFTPFWNYSPAFGKFEPSGPVSDPNWISSETITKVNNAGLQIESYDALNLYSSALFGYQGIFPIAIGSNAEVKQIANENFEDYAFDVSCHRPCEANHWNYRTAIDQSIAFIASDTAHTGRNSIRVPASSFAEVHREIKTIPDVQYTDTMGGKIILKNGCLDLFSPKPGKYLLSAWVMSPGDCQAGGYVNDSIHVSFDSSATIAYKFIPSGNIIEGWQRIEAVFEVPATAASITIILKAGGVDAYYDDIRIHPFHSNMKSFVYDNRSQRLMAELDANNYATFYEYNEEGKLIRTKKETDRGIVTLKENRTFLQSKFNQ